MTQAATATKVLSLAGKRTEPVQHTVLLVEDEEMVRKLVCEALKRQGYRVLACGDASEGLETSRQHGQIDVLLTDVVMPGMSGLEMAERIQKAQPQLRVVFMSGYPEVGVAGTELFHRCGYLQKPFTLKALTQMLATALEGGETARV